MVGPELCERSVEKRVVVLESVSLVHHQDCPADGPQELFVLQQNLVRGENGVKLQPLVRMAPFVLSDLRAKEECMQRKKIEF